jgi:hypothetical protein
VSPSDFPRSPKLLKGALVVFETSAPIPTNLIVFQYNPDAMSRAFRQAAGAAGGQGGDTQPAQPPLETFQIKIELDAADQLEAASENPLVRAVGLHPSLAALELLLSPSSSLLILNRVLALAGSSVVAPARAPLVLLVWGLARVVPVRIASLSVDEQAFDPLLNPIRAEVSLELRALTLPELRQAGPPFDTIAIVNQIAKEVLARANIFNSAQQIGGAISF